MSSNAIRHSPTVQTQYRSEPAYEEAVVNTASKTFTLANSNTKDIVKECAILFKKSIQFLEKAKLCFETASFLAKIYSYCKNYSKIASKYLAAIAFCWIKSEVLKKYSRVQEERFEEKYIYLKICRISYADQTIQQLQLHRFVLNRSVNIPSEETLCMIFHNFETQSISLPGVKAKKANRLQSIAENIPMRGVCYGASYNFILTSLRHAQERGRDLLFEDLQFAADLYREGTDIFSTHIQVSHILREKTFTSREGLICWGERISSADFKRPSTSFLYNISKKLAAGMYLIKLYGDVEQRHVIVYSKINESQLYLFDLSLGLFQVDRRLAQKICNLSLGDRSSKESKLVIERAFLPEV